MSVEEVQRRARAQEAARSTRVSGGPCSNAFGLVMTPIVAPAKLGMLPKKKVSLLSSSPSTSGGAGASSSGNATLAAIPPASSAKRTGQADADADEEYTRWVARRCIGVEIALTVSVRAGAHLTSERMIFRDPVFSCRCREMYGIEPPHVYSLLHVLQQVGRILELGRLHKVLLD